MEWCTSQSKSYFHVSLLTSNILPFTFYLLHLLETNKSGGASYYGYPDETYFNRVRMELAAKGITEDDDDVDIL